MPTGISAIPAFDAGSYLDRIKGVAPVQQVTPAPATTPEENTNTSNTGNSTTQSTTGIGQVDLNSDVLSILQSASPFTSSGNLISDLFDSGGTASSDYLSGLFGTVLFNYTSTRPLTQAINTVRNTSGNAGNNAIQSLIASYQNAQNAASAQARGNVASEVRRILGGQDSLIA